MHYRAIDYRADGEGTYALYNAVSSTVGQMRACGCVDAGWSADIRNDNEKRGKKRNNK